MMCQNSATFDWAVVQFHVAGIEPFMGLMTPENEVLFLCFSMDLPCPAVKLAALASGKPTATNMEVVEVEVLPRQQQMLKLTLHGGGPKELHNSLKAQQSHEVVDTKTVEAAE